MTAHNAGGLLSACPTSKSQAWPIEIDLLYLKKRDNTMAGVEQSTAIDPERPTPEQETHPPGRRGRRPAAHPETADRGRDSTNPRDGVAQMLGNVTVSHQPRRPVAETVPHGRRRKCLSLDVKRLHSRESWRKRGEGGWIRCGHPCVLLGHERIPNGWGVRTRSIYSWS